MSKLTNLLPRERVRGLSKEYLVRVGTVALCILAVLILMHAAMLLPSGVYLSHQAEARAEHIAQITTSMDDSPAHNLEARRAAVEADASRLAELAGRPAVVPVLASILSVPQAGVRIVGFSVTPEPSGETAMSVTGVSDTREALRRYRDALAALPFVKKADLPLSVYAAETAIPFTITLTATLAP